MGIDYGMGRTNIDHATGIRYGVIPQNDVLQAWADSSEADYGEPTCPKCGNEVKPDTPRECALVCDGEFLLFDTEAEALAYVEREDVSDFVRVEPHNVGEQFCIIVEDTDRGEYYCPDCRYAFDGDEAYGDEPLGFYLDDGEYKATCGEDGDIFILNSPYYTFGPFCSPCAPGAVYLRDGGAEGDAKAYCFAPDWFDYWREDGVEPAGEYCGEKTSCPYPVYRVSDNECVYKPA